MKKKLVLVYPNQRWYKTDSNTTWNLNPYTLCQLAAMVESVVEVKIIDAQFRDLTIEEFKQQIREFNPDYVGISVMSSEYAETLHIAAEAVKSVSSQIITIVGGIHATLEYMQIIGDTNINFAVRGEGEHVLPLLLQYLGGFASLPETGVVCMINGKEHIGQQAIVSDISKLPWPAYHLVPLADYLNTGPRVGPLRPPEYPYIRMSVTRGCPFGCTFCQVETISGKKIRTRDPLDVVNEILFLKEKYGIRSIQFDDDNIIGNKSFFKTLLTLMIVNKTDTKFIIGAFAVFLMTDELLDLMVKAGCVGVNVALESGNKRVLSEIVKKPVDLDIAIEKIKDIKERGLFCLANFIIGFPGETWEEIRETIAYAEGCGADYIKIFVAVPLKNTKLWDLAVACGAIENPATYTVDWRFSTLRSNEWTSKDVSILRAYEWDRINFATPEKRIRVAELWGLPEEEMNRIRKETRDNII